MNGYDVSMIRNTREVVILNNLYSRKELCGINCTACVNFRPPLFKENISYTVDHYYKLVLTILLCNT